MDVRYRQVSKSFGAHQALAPLDLHIADGKFLALLGPSGCGKTTALRLLAGLERPSGGQIFIGERDITYVATKDRDIAMVFQSYALYPHLKVADNIAYPLRVRKVEMGERMKQVRKVAELLGLEDYLERRPAQLSGGQRQRVALARAIIRRPQAFLMDEPLSNLDAQLRLQMRVEIKRLQRELATTTLYVTHDQVEAMTMADVIAVMHRGKLQQLASPAEIYARPANLFVATFCGSPPMNILTGEIAEGLFIHGSGRVAMPGFAHRGAAKLGFRPEHAELVEPCDERRLCRRDLCGRAARQRDARHHQCRRHAAQHPPAGGFRGSHRHALRRQAGGAPFASFRRRDRHRPQDRPRERCMIREGICFSH